MATGTVTPPPQTNQQQTQEENEQKPKKDWFKSTKSFFKLHFTRTGKLKKVRNKVKDLARPENNYKMISRLAAFTMIGHTIFFNKLLKVVRPDGFNIPKVIPYHEFVTLGIEWLIPFAFALTLEQMMINMIANKMKVHLIKFSFYFLYWERPFYKKIRVTKYISVGAILAAISIIVSIGAYMPFLVDLIKNFQDAYKPSLGIYRNIPVVFENIVYILLTLILSFVVPMIIFLYAMKIMRQIKPGVKTRKKGIVLTKKERLIRNTQIFEDIRHHLGIGDKKLLSYTAIAARFLNEEGKPRISDSGVNSLISRTAKGKNPSAEPWQVEVAKAFKAARDAKK